MKSLLLFLFTWAAFSLGFAMSFAAYEGAKGAGNVDKNQKQIAVMAVVSGLVVKIWLT